MNNKYKIIGAKEIKATEIKTLVDKSIWNKIFKYNKKTINRRLINIKFIIDSNNSLKIGNFISFDLKQKNNLFKILNISEIRHRFPLDIVSTTKDLIEAEQISISNERMEIYRDVYLISSSYGR